MAQPDGFSLLDLEPLPAEESFSANNNELADEICRRSVQDISYNDFYWNHMQRNWPVVLTGVSTNWECRRHWTLRCKETLNNNEEQNKPTSCTAINYDYLRSRIGNCRVPVADCATVYFNSHEKCEMDFFDFLSKWQDSIEESTQEANSNERVKKTTNTKLYLKDWHLKTVLPDYEFYSVPKQFASDWLNEQLVVKGGDDYRFVYMGPKDTWTPFHADVFGSYSWSTNITGCKKWLMLPPGEELKLKDNLGNLPFRIDENLLERQKVRYFTLLQSENEAIFVPSGWYHQVWNLTDTISVNHNWFNACNIAYIWDNLQTNMQQVINEIEDCRDMDNFEAHCQTMLRASFGLNYLDFIEHLEFITQRRLAAIIDSNSNNNSKKDASGIQTLPALSSKFLLFDTYILNDYHIQRDLECIEKVLAVMLQDEIICENRNELFKRCTQMLESITKQRAK